MLITFPFFHIGGWNTFTPLFHKGITSVLLREFDPGLILKLIHEGRVENFGAVEAMLQFLIAHPKFRETDFSKLKAITTATAPCSKAVIGSFCDPGIGRRQQLARMELPYSGGVSAVSHKSTAIGACPVQALTSRIISSG
ncbi:MAG: AMP-binding protein [Candidatus Competibacter sp.]|nr:AMP-binding protein [Candidatus Competibacter sp.]